MKWWKQMAAAICLMGIFSAPAAATPIPVRGIVEGFYGTPWTQAERMDMLKFCGEHGLNAYIYAPKDDPYHRAKWREPYPYEKLRELSRLVKQAQEHQVRFIFAISPGLDLRYSMVRGNMDRILMRQKLEAMYQIGIRDFAVFFDDIKDHDGQAQAELLNWLQENFVQEHEDISPLITVPTEYFFRDMKDPSGNAKEYTKAFSSTMEPTILPLFTGDEVVCEGLPDSLLEQANRLYGRKLGIWWNYPVTDYMEAKLALGPVENLPHQGDVPAIFFNPMTHSEMSKIALATGADYAQDPEHYHPQDSWEKAIRAQYGALAPEMELFAEHSQHMENSWALAGRPDGAELRKAMDELWQSWPNASLSDEHWDTMHLQLETLLEAVRKLQKGLPKRQLSECRLQLRQLERIAEADLHALELLKSDRGGDGKRTERMIADLEKRRHRIERKEKHALISEQTCKAFIQEVLDYVHTGEKPKRNETSVQK